MSLKSLPIALHLNPDQDAEQKLLEIEKIITDELQDLDSKHSISNNQDKIIVWTSKNCNVTVMISYYSSKQLFSINCEMLEDYVLFRSNSIGDRLKKRLNFLLNANQEDSVEVIPMLKRDNPVPLYFLSSDYRIFQYDFEEVLVNENSPFQNIKILKSPTLGNCLLLDDLQNLAEADLPYTHGLMNYGSTNFKDKEILILGGGDGALLNELLKESPKFVTMIDIDEKVMLYCREYLRKACANVLDNFETEHYKIIVGDCIEYMQNYIASNRQFDIIFNDLTDIPISSEEKRDIIVDDNQKLWAFVKKILEFSLELLHPGGLYFNHAIGINCKQSLQEYENVLREIKKFQIEFSSHSRFVPSFLENWVFYQIKKIS
ncbi:putative signaling protein hedgehog [Sarcoptes scabiei]|nr:putative signaling protein hedgehog [Sarcoptes scabiei]